MADFSLSDFLLPILKTAGFTSTQAQQQLNQLNLDINAAIVDNTLAALTPPESQLLGASLTQPPVNPDTASAKIRQACQVSANHPNPDEIADQSRVSVIMTFWNSIAKNLDATIQAKLFEELTSALKQLSAPQK